MATAGLQTPTETGAGRLLERRRFRRRRVRQVLPDLEMAAKLWPPAEGPRSVPQLEWVTEAILSTSRSRSERDITLE